ncbi:MAG: FkbM family methyltransferase [Parvularculaceae bacterium]
MIKLKERPTRDFKAFFEHLKKNKKYNPTTCIDVGAASGTIEIYQAFPNAHHIAFEPLPEFHKTLEQALKPYSHEIHHCALMEAPGEKVLLRHADKFGSSLMHKRKGEAEDLISVPVDTLDNVMKDKELKGEVLLKTDCQGADLFVIKGGLNTLRYANVVIIEASLFRFWGEHQPDIYDIICFMKERGFALYDILDGIYRPKDHALGQVDLAFVKENGRFRNVHHW